VQLLLERPVAVRRLLLVRPERAQLVLLGEHPLHPVGADGPGQLVLEVARARVPARLLERRTVAVAERAQEVALLADVVEARQVSVAVLREGLGEVPVPAERDDGDALGGEVAAAAARERLDGQPVARAFDEHDGAWLHPGIRSPGA
jgi:hypothetical protein